MKTITRQKLLDVRACYDPAKVGLTDGMELTPVEFIDQFRDEVREPDDIQWALVRNEYMDDRELRLFAVWCARKALKLIDDPDPRSVAACDVAERYADGKATLEELKSAETEAEDAEHNAWAAWNAARAVRNTARAAQAAWLANQAAAWAVRDTARAAWNAARAAARADQAALAAAYTAQIDRLRAHFSGEEPL